MASPTRDVAAHAPVQQYSLQHFDAISSSKQPRHHPYSQSSTQFRHQYPRSSDLGAGVDGTSTNTAPVRRRISRACDQCNQLRTRCDGQEPCGHCSEFSLTCEYMRERKKRGKTSRKDTAQRDPAANALSSREYSSEAPSPSQTHNGYEHRCAAGQAPPTDGGQWLPASQSGSMSTVKPQKSAILDGPYHLNKTGSLAQDQEQVSENSTYPQFSSRQGAGASPTPMSLNGFSLGHDYDRPSIRGTPTNGISSSQLQPQMSSQHTFQGFGENIYPPLSPPNLQASSPGFRFSVTGESPLAGYFGATPIVGSPGWLNLPSPSNYQNHRRRFISLNTLRFPVLKPLLPYIESIIPVSLACDLLELYFTSSSTTHTHPVSPYILGYIFRKQSFLNGSRPRICTPALLSSMLWLAAQSSDSPFLTSPPSARGRVCQKLLDITIALLKPLIHGPPAGDHYATDNIKSVINGVALGGLGVAMTGGDQRRSICQSVLPWYLPRFELLDNMLGSFVYIWHIRSPESLSRERR